MIVLESKITIPPEPSRIIPRLHLRRALERSVLRSKLILITSPPGYGKTTLLADWARHTRLPVAWVSVSEEDNETERFLRYLLAAWEKVQPDIVHTPVGILLGSSSPDIQMVLPAFLNAAQQEQNPLVFILDDYHHIQNPEIHNALTFFIDHLPAEVHFILSSRSGPPLPLARYRAHRQLFEIHADVLHFTLQETARFLKRSMRLDLPPNIVTSLHANTEGWIAGILLAALTLQHKQVDRENIPLVSGGQRFIADYLIEDVFIHLPLDVQEFLLRTSILDRLSGPLCDAVTNSHASQEMLEFLERENCFLVSLDNHRTWYRYHHLFAGFLLVRLQHRHIEEMDSLHRSAGYWYLAHDLPEQAFQHALQAGDTELVQQIFDRHLFVKLFGGEVRQVQDWLDAIPESWYTRTPALGLARAFHLALTGSFAASAQCLDEVEKHLTSTQVEDVHRSQARVIAGRCLMACIQNDLTLAETYAHQALQTLSDGDTPFRVGIHHSLGDTYRQNGLWDEARANYLKVLSLPNEPTFRFRVVHVYGALADLDLKQGNVNSAAAYWRKALDAIQDPSNWARLPLPLTGWVHIRLGEILYERNHLADAAQYVTSGLERVELGGDVPGMIAGYLIAGQLKLAAQDHQAAQVYLEKARSLLEQAPFPEWIARGERLQVALWLAQERHQTAVDWAKKRLEDQLPARESETVNAAIQPLLAWILITQGKPPLLEQANNLLEHLISAGQSQGLKGVVIEALALQSLLRWKKGDQPGALTALERSLRLAEPEGYMRTFIDLGLPMAWVLQEARTRHVMPAYVATLLTAFGSPDLPSLSNAALPEPLSHREQEILERLASGLSNREIAAQLVISPETVKKHTANIYGKLGVRGRMEAVVKARAFGLLE